MLRYTPVNLIASPSPVVRMIGQLTPQKPEPPSGMPSWGVNLLIIGTGVALGIGAYPYRRKPVGDLLVHAGGGMAGIGLIFAILDLVGFRRGP
jgi:hypothetical protein